MSDNESALRVTSTVTVPEIVTDRPETAHAMRARLASASHITRITPKPNYLDLGDLWRYRETLFALISRDFKIRYRQTVIGVAWAVLQPLLTMLVFTLIFGGVVQVSSDGLPYALFSFSALVPWTFFSNGLTLGADSLVGQAHLVRKVYFPRIIIPLARVAGGMIDFTLSLLMLFVLIYTLGGDRFHPRAQALWSILSVRAEFFLGKQSFYPRLEALWAVPLLILLMILVTFGLSLLFSAWNTRYRDIRYLIPFAIQLGMFVSPVVYSTSQLDMPTRVLFGLNPMTTVIEGFRWALVGSNPPLDGTIIVSLAMTALILISGMIIFFGAEGIFADIV